MAGRKSRHAATPAASSSAACAEPLVLSEPHALALLAHLVTSAELCMTEPYDYGMFLLIDAASRLAASIVPHSSEASRAFLVAFLEEVNTKKLWPTRDRERYGAFLRETSRRTAEHLVARADEDVATAFAPNSEGDPDGR